MTVVALEWTHSLPWKCQSILQSGFRGPDQHHMPSVKKVNRWMRSVSCNNADPSKPYMSVSVLPNKQDVCNELAYASCHYAHHFADALRIIAIWHPDTEIKLKAWFYHEWVALELFHFVPENDESFSVRHRDKIEHS